jgi:hypothetical protein
MATTSEQLIIAVDKISALGVTYEEEVGKWQTERTAMSAVIQAAVAASPNLYKKIYVAIEGSDTTGSGSILLPFRTANKGFEVLQGNTGGYSEIVLGIGTYDLTVDISMTNQTLFITSASSSADTRLNIDKQRFRVRNTFIHMYNIHIHSENSTPTSAPHHNYPIRMYGGGFHFGLYRTGVQTAENNTFKFTSNNLGLITSEHGGIVGKMTYAYLENLGDDYKDLIYSETAIVKASNITSVGFKPLASRIGDFTGTKL